MIKEYIFHFKKLLYVVLFGSLVWFISFTLFPENQIIKISIGDISPNTFVAPKYIEIIDEDKTEANKEIALQSVRPIYSIDNDLNNSAINGITDMFLTRLGENSKVIITGDETQIDLYKKDYSGLRKTRKKLANIDEISVMEFENSDIVRNPIVSKILEVFPEK